MIEKSRKMKDITLKEISLVDLPANKRSFLLYKQDGKSKDGSLLKAKKNINIKLGANIMDERIAKLLKQFFGDKEVKLEKSELNEETIIGIEKSLTTVNDYKEEMPSDLIAAIGTLGILAGQGYKQSESVEKAGAKLSKDTVAKLKAIISAAEDLLPKEASADGDDDETTKKSDENSSELQKTVEDLAKSIADISGKLEKKETSDQLTGITDALTKVSDRLKVIEGKPASTKKSIDDNSTEKKEVQKDSEGRIIHSWPSLTGTGKEED